MLVTYNQWVSWRDGIANALRAPSNLDVLVDGVDITGEPAYRLDGDGRVHMSAVLWMGVGVPVETDDSVDGARDLGSLAWQVTAVGGDADRAARAALKVRVALTGKRLVPGAGQAFEQFDTAIIREDREASPSRFYVPLPYAADLP